MGDEDGVAMGDERGGGLRRRRATRRQKRGQVISQALAVLFSSSRLRSPYSTATNTCFEHYRLLHVFLYIVVQ